MIYIKQIDGLRCVAIGLVLAAHFGIGKLLSISLLSATMGVNLFFVISGFLITLILLKLKEIKDSKKVSIYQLLKIFYIRRILRIFPIYYLTILISLILGIYPLYQIFVWLITYTYNIYACFGPIGPNVFSHFWSLAVEEQFYLFCPILVLIIQKKHLIKLFIMMILIGVLSRFLFNNLIDINLRGGLIGYQFTICCLDSFGFGGLLAYYFLYFPNFLGAFIRKYFWLFGMAFAGFLAVELVFVSDFGGGATLSRFFFSIVCFGVIGYASLEKGFGGIIGRFLENPVIVYLGKISYGIYVYHIFVGRFFYTLPLSFLESYYASGNPLGVYIENIYLKTFLRFAVTIAVAAISWHFFELPINRLKNKFSYSVKD